MKRSPLLLLNLIFFISGCTSSTDVVFIFRREPVLFQEDLIYVDSVCIGRVEKVKRHDDIYYVTGALPDTVKISRTALVQAKLDLRSLKYEMHISNDASSDYLVDGDSLNVILPLSKPMNASSSIDSLKKHIAGKDSVIIRKTLDFLKVYMERKEKGLN